MKKKVTALQSVILNIWVETQCSPAPSTGSAEDRFRPLAFCDTAVRRNARGHVFSQSHGVKARM